MGSLIEIQTQWSLLDLIEANILLEYEDEVKLLQSKDAELAAHPVSKPRR